HTTVGNSGVAGLGGIGNAGAGGGEGGFGKSYVGSGGVGGKSLADVRLGKDIELDGGLDQAVVRATIVKYLSQIQACYQRGLREKPHLAGQVSMDFEIAASGKLNYAKVKTSSLDYPATEDCIAKAMLTWQFPKPVGGTLVKVNYPFALKPSNYM
ncbi:MAG: AgmX/PglI C-terminal domain-containing protein, partial [Pseudomonadota bacterium]